METQLRSHVASLEGRRVSLSLRDGRRIDDCQLVSAGRGKVSTIWVHTNGRDFFVPDTDVMDLWEASSAATTTWRQGQVIGITEWRMP